ncbi:MAG TPA: pseudouridine synthase [Candidatus Saccharimonadia bacterium]|nr:pseudouridine synthase [Candidatus Saccharimonadia bacterium]
MRINQFVAQATGLSRRSADAAIADGRVTVWDRPAVLGTEVTPSADIRLDGNPLRIPNAFRYIMLNKPPGYISSRAQQGKNPTLYALLPAEYQSLRITGRLDRDSSGLVILTDDGDFIQRHTHPSYGKQKVYEVTLNRTLTTDDHSRLEAGIVLDDGISRVNIMSRLGRTVTLGLGEGRNRQIRRTFDALGLEVERLHRTAMGPYQLGQLQPGSWIEISQKETSD